MVEEKILGTSGSLKSIKDYDNIRDFLRNKSILILGFGREGKSTYNFIKTFLF